MGSEMCIRDRIERVRAQAEFWGVGLADEDGARRAHARDGNGIRLSLIHI